MIRPIAAVVLVLLVRIPWAGAQTGAEREVAAAAQYAEAALKARDRQALERIIGDGFEFVHSTGRIEDRGSFITRAAAGQLAMQRIPAETLSTSVRVFGETAIRTTRTSVRMNPADTAAAPTEMYTRDVYSRWSGDWHWVSAQSTIVAQASAGR